MITDFEMLPPPNNPEVFESLCLELWREIWQDPDAQKNGRNGQPQAGVDIFGQENGKWVGVQCKQKDGLLRSELSVKELEAEAKKAGAFRPPLSAFVLATSGPADARVQERARELTVVGQREGTFSVAVWSWWEIWQELCRRTQLLEQIGPLYWPLLWRRTAVLRSLHQLPPGPIHFTGREEILADLEKHLTTDAPSEGVISALQVHGMGGVGKTTLATALAHRLKGRYPDAQLLLNLRGADPERRPPITPAEAMQNIIHCFHPEARLPENPDALRAIYRSVLQEDNRRTLLFLDNAAGPDQIKPLFPPANCLLLVTSRTRINLPGFQTLSLDCLPTKKSEELLLSLAPRLRGEARKAAELCGHLPLALEVLAGTVNDRNLFPVPELLDRLRSRQDTLAAVDAALQVSLEMLPASLRLRLCLLSVFPASFDLRAARAVWGGFGKAPLPLGAPTAPSHPTLELTLPNSPTGESQNEDLERARYGMQALMNASLVEWNETSNRFRLHDLIRQLSDGEISEVDRERARLCHADHYCGVGREAEHLYLQGGEHVLPGLELFTRERANFDAAFYWLEARKDMTSAVLLKSLVGAVPWTSLMRMHPTERLRWHEARLRAAQVTNDPAAQGWAFSDLGIAHRHLGRWDQSIECHKQQKDILHAIGDQLGECNALCNLGKSYLACGRASEADQVFEQALVIAREIHDVRWEGHALGNLGLVRCVLGDMHKAIDLLNQRLVIDRQLEDRRAEGKTLDNLGVAYGGLGDVQKAATFHDLALTIAREIGDLPGEGSALWHLAQTSDRMGNRPLTIRQAEGALKILQLIGAPAIVEVQEQLAAWRGGAGETMAGG